MEDSVVWSKKFTVFAISREQLRTLGFSHDQIRSLTDEDMEQIADLVGEQFFNGFDEQVKFVMAWYITSQEFVERKR